MTYADFIRTIERNALAIPNVKTFNYSNYALSENSDIEYAAVMLYPNDSGQTIDSHDVTYNFRMVYADRLTQDKCNTIEVQSIGIQVLSELLNVMKQTDKSVRVAGYSISFFKEGFADLCAGVVFNVSVSFKNDLDNCYFIEPQKLCK